VYVCHVREHCGGPEPATVARSAPKKESDDAKLPSTPAAPKAPNSADASEASPPDAVESAVTINERPLFIIEFEAYQTILPTKQLDADFLRDLLFALENDKVAQVLVQGHTDNSGNQALNKRLSLERAAYVTTLLVEEGVPKSLIESEAVSAQQPRSDNSTAVGRAKNRRVEIKTTYKP